MGLDKREPLCYNWSRNKGGKRNDNLRTFEVQRKKKGMGTNSAVSDFHGGHRRDYGGRCLPHQVAREDSQQEGHTRQRDAQMD